MANLMAIVANKGVSYKPYLVEEVKDSVTNETLYKHELVENEKIEIGQNTWKHLHKALESAVDYGTARRTKFKNLSVAAKTGTAENPQGEDHAWVVAYAPADNPELALAVIVENGGFGGSVSVPVAKEVLKKYFNIVEEPEEDLSNGNNNDGH